MSKQSLLLGFTEAKISAQTLLELLITAFLYQTVTIPWLNNYQVKFVLRLES